MNIKRKDYITVVCFSTILLFILSPRAFAQPSSTIDSDSGLFYIPYDMEELNALIISTSEVPTPDCHEDTADGDPDYFWDFGSTLDAADFFDGTWGPDGVASSPDRAAIFSDSAGSYNVTVYCTEWFTPSNGGPEYSNSTIPDTSN